jgi:pyruvate kinase
MKKIITTVGPSLLKRTPITEVHNDRNIYRINGAHGSIKDIEEYILEIRKQEKTAEILMDLPGNKVRTCNFKNDIEIMNGKVLNLSFDQTNYKNFYSHIKPGDVVWANDSIFRFTVEKIDENKNIIYLMSESDGLLKNNKGMHVRGIHKDIPFLFKKDIELIELANKHNLAYIGLSFVRNASDIKEAKALINKDIRIISKVETKAAVKNLTEILNEVEYILVDRGDLSTEIGIEKIPAYQKFIINKATFHNKKVFLATQFLKNMEINPIPTIPEVIDMFNTMQSGVYGIQMSEETAVGQFPKECIEMIKTIMDEIESSSI